MTQEDEIEIDFENLLKKIKDAKGDERTPRARSVAVTATMVEKALAYFVYFVRDGNAK
jgi:hypothetical protein